MSEPTEGPGFDAFGLSETILKTLAELGFERPTPIQEAAVPPMLEGRDVIGQARTGSGKTAAFGLPIVERLIGKDKQVRALIMCPTRELALQNTEALRTYAKGTKVRIATVYGGSPYPPQIKALRGGASIVVGTPGRLIDHLERGNFDASHIEFMVLDEADEMLRMGFQEEVERILSALPETRQSALFSATMPKRIRKIAKRYLNDPVMLQVESSALSVGHIEQRSVRVPERHKLDALVRVLATRLDGSTLIFVRTRRGCAEIADKLAKRGIAVDSLHGDLNQAARERVTARFRSGQLTTVVATDVAARGIDVNHITQVINHELPMDTETYVHRIGRTGRAGRDGLAISFIAPSQRQKLQSLRRALDADIAPYELPSDGVIARYRKKALANEVIAVLEGDGLDDARAWYAELCEDKSPEDIAAALAHVLAMRADVSLKDIEDTGPPAWMRPPADRVKRDRRMLNEVEIAIKAGRFDRINASDIVGALAHDGGLQGSRIGKVSMVDRVTFVGLPREDAERLLSQRNTIEIRGNDVPIRLNERGPRPGPHHRNAGEGRPGGGGGGGYRGGKGGDRRPPKGSSRRPLKRAPPKKHRGRKD
jgi:ATP-dependent RNA helicase DeaD